MVTLCLLAATADAAYLRKGKPSRRLDDVECSDDPEWYHTEDYGEPEVTEICIGTSWTYLGGLFRKSKVDEDVPPCVEINQ